MLCSSITWIVLLVSLATAFPRLDPKSLQDLLKRGADTKDCPFSHLNAHEKSKRQAGFDPAAQRVSTTGKYAWRAPTAGDKRGPCPGLNALANHGYLPHNGIAPATTIIEATNKGMSPSLSPASANIRGAKLTSLTAYGMALDLGTFLAVYGTVFNGDALSLTPGYSIGGPANIGLLGGLLSGTGITRTPSGLSGSHNNYEGDTSATRGDQYVFGNNDLLQIPFFQQYYDAIPENTPAPEQYSALFRFRQSRFNYSIETNPYFFFPQFAGVLVTPAGYAFPPRMMANHSARYPQGYLDKETFKSFFAVTGEPGSFKYQPGYERIPDNWYKRAVGTEYSIPAFLLDVLEFARQDPRLLSVGGNTGTTNSFTGVNITGLTKGVFNGATLAQGNNLQCFIFQLIQAQAPGVLTGLYEDLTKALQPLKDSIQGAIGGLGCPQLMELDQSLYEKYPGYKKNPAIKIISHDLVQASIQHRNMADILVDGQLDVEVVRSHFPALKQNQIFLDNAGGSQVLSDAINSIRTYLEETNVQLGASYNIGQKATQKYNEGLRAAADFINADVSEIVIGPSTTQLYANLAQSFALSFPANAEIIISSIDHEANISSWVRLAKIRNLTLKWWTPSPSDQWKLTAENLHPLLSEKTKLVTCTHTSNMLGSIHDIRRIADEVHTVQRAMLCVDGVAYAPHREVDVKALGVDFYSFSWYKVYGPHIAVLYASSSAQQHVESLGHYFHTPANTLTIKLGLAAASYELVSTIPTIVSYFGSSPSARKKTWAAIAAHEENLQAILLDYLNSREDVAIFGETNKEKEKRVPVISFGIKGRSSKEVVEKVDEMSDYGIRWGSFYSKRLVDEVLGCGEEGVVRVSMVHYNTEEEIKGLVEVLKKVLG
ncbi:MAG: hypothetical protein Q9226_004568 [Calogaya cf. arnoldii]